MQTTLNQIRSHKPCADGWKKLLAYLGKTEADDAPLLISTIVESNDLDDAIWCLRAVDGHDKEIRLFAVWCAQQVEYLLTDQRSIYALEVAENYAYGEATQAELEAARYAARYAALETARDATWSAVRAAAWSAASAAACDAWDAAFEAARDAEWSAVRAAACDTQQAELLRICREFESAHGILEQK